VFHSKQAYEALTGRVEIEHLSENTFGSLIPGLAYVGAKQVLDFILALVLIPLLSPVFLMIAVAIRWDSPGPVIFRQERVGYRGNSFTCFKFRTMKYEPGMVESEAEPHKVATADDDDRVTRLGRWLRNKRLDEFPQMINILRGEMSFIGPRPEAVALSRWYQRELPFYLYRHVVRPGISGWAQINQGHVTDVDLVLGKLHYDFFYIKNFSPWLDALITLKTLGIMVRGIGAR
jgi:lipopolysaccharide/colanic/teichoic acid biosynthesis glycosyltransferase